MADHSFSYRAQKATRYILDDDDDGGSSENDSIFPPIELLNVKQIATLFLPSSCTDGRPEKEQIKILFLLSLLSGCTEEGCRTEVKRAEGVGEKRPFVLQNSDAD